MFFKCKGASQCHGERELQVRGWALEHLHLEHVTAFEIQTADGSMAVNLWHDHTLNDIITRRDGFPRSTYVQSEFLSLPKLLSFFIFPLPFLLTWQVDMTAARVLFQQTSAWLEWWQLMVNFLILPRSTLNNTAEAMAERSGAWRWERGENKLENNIVKSEKLHFELYCG